MRRVSIFWLENLYILPKFKRLALKVHVLWCKTGIYSWNLSIKLSLIHENLFPIPLLCNLRYTSFYFTHKSMKNFTHKSMQEADPRQSLPCFLILIPAVLGRYVNFKMPKRLLYISMTARVSRLSFRFL